MFELTVTNLYSVCFVSWHHNYAPHLYLKGQQATSCVWEGRGLSTHTHTHTHHRLKIRDSTRAITLVACLTAMNPIHIQVILYREKVEGEMVVMC